MLHLAQHELDDIEAAIETWLGDAGRAHERRGTFIDAVERIYEVCQTAHARELRACGAVAAAPAKKVEIEP